MIEALCLSLVLLQDEADERAHPWNRFRGPNGTGLAADEAEYPTRLDPEQNALWRTALPPGKSSPILSESGVFLTGHAEGQLYVLGVERSDGSVRFRTPLEPAREGFLDQRNGPASPSAAVDGDSVVVFFQDLGLVGLSHKGEVRWQVPLGPFDNVYGMGASPVLVDGVAYLVCDQSTGSFALAVDAKTGATQWRVERPEATSGHVTPVLWSPDGEAPRLTVAGSFLLDAYDLESGVKRWWSRGLCFEMKSVPVVHDDMLYVAGYGSPFNQPGTLIELPDFADQLVASDADEDGAIGQSEMPQNVAFWFDFVDLAQDGVLDAGDWDYLRAALSSRNGLLALRGGGEGGDRTEDALAWSWRRSVPQLPSPLLVADRLYVLQDSGGLLSTLDPSSGEQLERGRLADAMDDYYASPVAGGGKLYLVSRTGIVSVLAAGPGFEPLSTTELEEPSDSTPALADGVVYLRTDAALYAFGR